MICKFSQCPYCGGGFCTMPEPAIDENGHCSYIWFRVQPRQSLVPADFKKNIIILDAEEVEKEEDDKI